MPRGAQRGRRPVHAVRRPHPEGTVATLDERKALRVILSEERTLLGARLDSLRRALASVVDATDLANVDDEHDPEGTTIAFDRAQILSMIESAQLHLAPSNSRTRRSRWTPLTSASR